MRNNFSSFCRLIACFLVMSILTSGIAMAAYACPQLVPAPAEGMVMDGTPCTEMDKEKPVHCAEARTGAQLALEHLASTPSLAPLTLSFVMPAPMPVSPSLHASVRDDIPWEAGVDPPYLRTLRLRI